MLKKKTINAFEHILDEIGSIGTIALVDEKTLKEQTGRGLGANWGIAYHKKRLIGIRQSSRGHRQLVDLKNTLWHEVAHILWPNQAHWWIECFAAKMSKTENKDRYTKRYNHSVDDLRSRSKLLDLAKNRIIEIEK